MCGSESPAKTKLTNVPEGCMCVVKTKADGWLEGSLDPGVARTCTEFHFISTLVYVTSHWRHQGNYENWCVALRMTDYSPTLRGCWWLFSGRTKETFSREFQKFFILSIYWPRFPLKFWRKQSVSCSRRDGEDRDEWKSIDKREVPGTRRSQEGTKGNAFHLSC